MISRLKISPGLAFGALLACAGCGGDGIALSTETDEPLYRDGQQMEKQGRTQEALADYLKVIVKRGDVAPESHLEAGLIYLEHTGDPIEAIHHFRKYLEQEPNSRQAASVRGLINTAELNFARSLPGKPLENPTVAADPSQRLRLENETQKSELAALRAGDPPLPTTTHPATSPVTAAGSSSPIALAPLPAGNPPPAKPAAVPASPSGRTHTVAKGDSLFSLAQKYYGSGSSAKVQEIVAANHDQLPSASSPLKIGMVLKIP